MMLEYAWKWAVGVLTAVAAGAWAHVHRRISNVERRIDRVEDEFRADIREGFHEASEGRTRIWKGLTDGRREMKEDLQKMEDRIVKVINGGHE